MKKNEGLQKMIASFSTKGIQIESGKTAFWTKTSMALWPTIIDPGYIFSQSVVLENTTLNAIPNIDRVVQIHVSFMEASWIYLQFSGCSWNPRSSFAVFQHAIVIFHQPNTPWRKRKKNCTFQKLKGSCPGVRLVGGFKRTTHLKNMRKENWINGKDRGETNNAFETTT